MQLLAGLETTRAETLKYFALGEQDLARTYGPGKWSIRFLLHHLADSETVLNDRIRRVVSEPRQVYDSVRSGIIHLARIHYEKSGHLEFVHSVTGVRTLKDEFDKVAAHNAQHLAQIRAALAPGQPR